MVFVFYARVAMRWGGGLGTTNGQSKGITANLALGIVEVFSEVIMSKYSVVF